MSSVPHYALIVPICCGSSYLLALAPNNILLRNTFSAPAQTLCILVVILSVLQPRPCAYGWLYFQCSSYPDLVTNSFCEDSTISYGWFKYMLYFSAPVSHLIFPDLVHTVGYTSSAPAPDLVHTVGYTFSAPAQTLFYIIYHNV